MKNGKNFVFTRALCASDVCAMRHIEWPILTVWLNFWMEKKYEKNCTKMLFVDFDVGFWCKFETTICLAVSIMAASLLWHQPGRMFMIHGFDRQGWSHCDNWRLPPFQWSVMRIVCKRGAEKVTCKMLTLLDLVGFFCCFYSCLYLEGGHPWNKGLPCCASGPEFWHNLVN